MLRSLEKRKYGYPRKEEPFLGVQVAKVLLSVIGFYAYKWCSLSVSSPGSELKRPSQEQCFSLLFWDPWLVVHGSSSVPSEPASNFSPQGDKY